MLHGASKLDELADAPPDEVIELPRPCLRFLTRSDEPAPEAGRAES